VRASCSGGKDSVWDRKCLGTYCASCLNRARLEHEASGRDRPQDLPTLGVRVGARKAKLLLIDELPQEGGCLGSCAWNISKGRLDPTERLGFSNGSTQVNLHIVGSEPASRDNDGEFVLNADRGVALDEGLREAIRSNVTGTTGELHSTRDRDRKRPDALAEQLRARGSLGR